MPSKIKTNGNNINTNSNNNINYHCIRDRKNNIHPQATNKTVSGRGYDSNATSISNANVECYFDNSDDCIE
jgi:hypothetical protein